MRQRANDFKWRVSRIAQDYLQFFEGWQMLGKEAIYRRCDAVIQQIGFERLRTGEYRPVGGVRILTSSNHAGLAQHLGFSLRAIDPDRHSELRGQVVEAMRREFRPDVSSPLSAQAVLRAYESENAITQPDRVALATLNAYVGETKKSLYWCSGLERELDSLKRSLADWETERQHEVASLKSWIESGIAAERLQQTIELETARLGVG